MAALALATAAALGMATLIYYGQYIQPILEQTLPYLLRVGGSDTSVGLQNREPFLSYVLNYWPRMDYLRPSGSYGLQLALPLGLLGMFSFREWRIRALLACWLAVALRCSWWLAAGSRWSISMCSIPSRRWRLAWAG